MKYLVLSTSLDPDSRSRVLAREAQRCLAALEADTTWLDLRDQDIALCDAATVWDHPATNAVRDAIDRADGIVFGVGIYNYSASAAAKTVLELAGKAWRDKVVSFVCAAGGEGSYMAVMSLANALMLDFRTVIVPRFVYTTSDAFDGDALRDEACAERIASMVGDLTRMTAALRA